MSREQVSLAVEQIKFARSYTLQLLDDIDRADWFRQPQGSPTHVAWQIGHLAMAQYGLTMLRLRGKEPTDKAIISSDFFRAFQKGTSPAADANSYPPISEIHETVLRVHEHSLRELETYQDADLQESLPAPTAVFATKLGSVFFCSSHELIHAGQIGLLRRMLGKDPLR